jgi:ribosomal RNA-processing protein 36
MMNDVDHSSSGDDSSSSSSSASEEQHDNVLDDLPTDDSVSLEGSDDDDDDSEEDSGEDRRAVDAADSGSSKDDHDDDCSSSSDDGSDDISNGDSSNHSNDDDVPLEQRLMTMQRQQQPNAAARSHQQRERKRQALKVATERLKAFHQQRSKNDDEPNKKKKSKHAPTEVSSRRSAHRRISQNIKNAINSSGIGVTIGAHTYKPRDPRLSSMSGHLQQDQFDRNYAFLEEIRDQEITELKRRIAAYKAPGRKGQKLRRKRGLTQSGSSLEEDQAELKRLQQEKASYERAQVERAAKQAVKRKIRDDVASGKRGVYYLKKREQKRMELEAKFEELRKRGGDRAVEKALAKRRKKNKSKDTGFMPRDL